MGKFLGIFAIVVAGLLLGSATGARADIIFTESFDQDVNSEIADDSNWSNVQNFGGQDPYVASGSLSYTPPVGTVFNTSGNLLQLADNNTGAHHVFAEQTETVYVGLLLNVTEVPDSSANDSNWFQMQTVNNNNVGLLEFERVDADTYRLRTSTDGGGSSWVTTGDLEESITYHLMFEVAHVPSNPGDSVTLWVNPGLAPTDTALYNVTSTEDATGNNLHDLRLIDNNSWRSEASWQVDEINIATTWDEANQLAVPEPGSLSLLLFSMVATHLLRRRR